MGILDVDDNLVELITGKKSKPKTKRKKFSRTEEKMVYEKHKHRCAICNKKTDFDYGEIDHIKSLAKGGSNRLTNLQWLCTRCNKLKSCNKTNAQVKKELGVKSAKKKPKIDKRRKRRDEIYDINKSLDKINRDFNKLF